jgi:hypothetical protein
MLEKYKNVFNQTENFTFNFSNFSNFFGELKNKKVFFDFESINPAMRVIDMSLPFSQIVTQNCSI